MPPARLSAAAGGALGSYARSSDRGDTPNRGSSGASSAPAGRGGTRHPRADRGTRYRLLSVAQRLMYAPGLPRQLQNRLCSCHWARKGGDVEVRRNKATGDAHYKGLETCSNVWACPVCSGRITEQRREELQRALGYWKEQGGECYLCTGTFPHQRRDELRDSLAKMRKAADYFNTSRAVREAREAAGYVGSIRALEVTWGEWHGWHPHFHFLYFCRPGQRDRLQALETAWAEALIKAGLADRDQLNDMLRGADGEAAAWDVRNGDFAADYIAKFGHEPSFDSRQLAGQWGLAAEMVKGASKRGRRLRGVTPFTLLACAAGVVDLKGMSRGQAVAMFCEFAGAFKGQRQLYWSPKLRAVLSMGRLFTDAELPEVSGKPEWEKVGRITAEEWRLVLAHGARDAVLRAVEGVTIAQANAALCALLNELRRRPPRRDERVTEETGTETRVGLDSARAWGL